MQGIAIMKWEAHHIGHACLGLDGGCMADERWSVPAQKETLTPRIHGLVHVRGCRVHLLNVVGVVSPCAYNASYTHSIVCFVMMSKETSVSSTLHDR